MSMGHRLIAVIPLVLLASGPMRGDVEAPKVEITMGFLVEDTSCAQARYALVDFCGFLNGSRTPFLYVAVPGNKNVDRLLSRNVRLRGTMEFTDCSRPLIRATNVDLSDAPPPPCPDPYEPP